MQTRLEARSTEPLPSGTGVDLTGIARRFTGERRGAVPVVALEDLDLRVSGGETVTVVGPSGCGKSTLLEIAAGLQEPDAGRATIGGESSAGGRLAASSYMPQRDLLLPWRDALGNASLALECAGVRAAEARRRTQPLFERFGLGKFERSLPAELSGGMRQRVAFLRTLLAGRDVLLLDEPFAALDSITRASMQEWLAEALAAEPRTVITVTHDVEEALYLADRVAVMSPRPGRVVEEIEVPIPRPGPRRETVTDSAFVELRDRALEALEC